MFPIIFRSLPLRRASPSSRSDRAGKRPGPAACQPLLVLTSSNITVAAAAGDGGIDRAGAEAHGLDQAAITLAAAAIDLGIGVDDLPPLPRLGQRDGIVLAIDGREIADDRDALFARRLAQPGEDGILAIVG